MIKISNSLKFIFSLMLVHKNLLLYHLLCCILLAITNIIEPMLAKEVVDKSFYVKNINNLLQLALAWSTLYCLKYIFCYIQKKINLKYKIHTFKEIRTNIFSVLLKKPLNFFKEKSSSYVLSRFNNDIESLDGILLSNIISSLVSFFQIIIIIMIMFHINPVLCMITIIIKIIELILNVAFPLKKLYKSHNEALANIDASVQDSFQCVKLIKSANKGDFETERYIGNLELYLEKRINRDKINIIRDVGSRFIIEASYPLIVIIGGIGIFYNMISIGSVIAFLIYFQKITPLFNEVAYIIPIYKISLASLDRLYEFISVPNEDIYSGEPLEKIYSIEFRNIKFSYKDRPILKNINFKLYNNQMNALVGLSGSGKSTIANMLMGYLKPDSGEILINGRNLSCFKLKDIRKNISLLSQEPIILERSLRENLDYNCDDYNFKLKYSNIMKKTNLVLTIKRLKDGISTLLKQNGNNLSGGERQRVCLARELFKDASVYIFDEATSALDAFSEKTVMDNISNLSKKSITLVITHQLSNIKNADMIYVLHEGKIIEYGNHTNLIKNKKIYYDLYKKQKNDGGRL